MFIQPAVLLESNVATSLLHIYILTFLIEEAPFSRIFSVWYTVIITQLIYK